jgi:hypothetical protein
MRVRWSRPFRYAVSLTALLSLGLFLAKGVVYSWRVGQTDTRTQARRWVIENIPTGSSIGIGSFYHYGPQFEDRRAVIITADHAHSDEDVFADWKLSVVEDGLMEGFEPSAYRLRYLYAEPEGLLKGVCTGCLDYVVLSSLNYNRYFASYADQYLSQHRAYNDYRVMMEEFDLVKAIPERPVSFVPLPRFPHHPEILIYQVPPRFCERAPAVESD